VEIVRPGAARGLVELIRDNWSMARRTIADASSPSASADLRRWVSDYVRQSVSPEVAEKCVEFYASVDMRPLLPLVTVPTLILHRRGNRSAPISAGRAAAALIPDARFVALEGDSDSPFLGDTSYLETLTQFLDEGWTVEPSASALATGDVHTILFTDVEGSTALTQRLGDAKARDLLREHERMVREALKANSGSELKMTGDGFMASFASATKALECSIAMQRAFAQHNQSAEEPILVRVGMNAGEPIAEDEDLFGTAVVAAARIAAQARGGEILASDVVRQLVAGKKFKLASRGRTALKGLDEAVEVYEVLWGEED
jgi:class 3 adenylate cyclase